MDEFLLVDRLVARSVERYVTVSVARARYRRRRITNLPPPLSDAHGAETAEGGGSTGTPKTSKKNPVRSRERADPGVDAHRASLNPTQRADAFGRAGSSGIRHARARCVAASRRARREALRASNPNAFASERGGRLGETSRRRRGARGTTKTKDGRRKARRARHGAT